MPRNLPLILALACLAACRPEPAADPAATPASAADSASAQRIEADVRYLADDKLEGRDTGTRGYDLAAGYVARRYAELGLKPAGDDGTYFQRVPLLKALRQEQGAQLVVERDGTKQSLAFREEFLPGLNYNAPTHALTAPAVFVGQGVHAPDLGQDDFAGVDVRGKIAVLFPGAPVRFDNDRRAFYSSGTQKLRTLAERGAVGAVFVNTPEYEQRGPWSNAAAKWNMPGMRLRAADGSGIDTFPQLKATASVSAAAASRLFAGSAQTADTLFKANTAGQLKPFDLPGTLTLAGSTRIEPAESRNVVARLDGSDAVLGREFIAYTAHLDHIGVGAAVNGDSIYNGAMDNALGVSIMLEAARQLSATTAKPKRSLLFIALTGEEKGLLGAEWFASHPTVPRTDLVANINMDMPVLLAPSKDVVPIGLEHSTLKTALDTAAKEIGVGLSADPFPEEVVFVRSDQYAFVRAGVPAVYLDGGVEPAIAGGASPKDAMDRFLRNCYHQPCDDASQPIQYQDAARLARLNARIGALIGDAPERPKWNKGDFFGDRFAPAGKAD
ncbi:aminopeptidase [Pseudoxanthomonas yeongjuensis]|uniref:M28 family peptidase n=1 Tax=Pseudoxanthomonas yeongjuensis TaxID=377616 RepID=UPI001391BAEC|nr:M28 family peptidase [Pseudoxanthomonas yeongjuensis]KAF1717796.1 aminopeptidase [Pseudoxanthomonas yeongjuensis]